MNGVEAIGWVSLLYYGILSDIFILLFSRERNFDIGKKLGLLPMSPLEGESQ